MVSEPHTGPHAEAPPGAVEVPEPTAAPLVVSLGVALLGAGVAMGTAFLVVGAAVLALGLGLWVAHLLPGRGHVHEALVEPARRARPVTRVAGRVEQLLPGAPGYRVQLPTKVHPISAGVKGGILGGLVMPFPAWAWALFTGHSFWYPANLLAGIMVPNIERFDLEQFQPGLLVVAVFLHVTLSVVLGLFYGVLLPMLPEIPRPLAWGGLLLPLLWTLVTYVLMDFVNPVLARTVAWPWFIASQFFFGLVAALVVMGVARLPAVLAGLLGGLAGGVAMTLPAFLWALANGHNIWYPVNLLVGLVQPGLPTEELEHFRTDWLPVAVAIHAILSAGFGIAYGLLLPRLRPIPAPMAWGALVLPLLWTASNYSLMGVVNKTLQDRVSWPWFIVSQFVFGLAVAVVVVRSETIPIPPAGRGPDALPDFGAGPQEGQS
jgi:hypothetical protein